MSYGKFLSSVNPGLLIILVDQFRSMATPYGSTIKAQIAAMAVNRVIYELVMACQLGTKVKD